MGSLADESSSESPPRPVNPLPPCTPPGNTRRPMHTSNMQSVPQTSGRFAQLPARPTSHRRSAPAPVQAFWNPFKFLSGEDLTMRMSGRHARQLGGVGSAERFDSLSLPSCSSAFRSAPCPERYKTKMICCAWDPNMFILTPALDSPAGKDAPSTSGSSSISATAVAEPPAPPAAREAPALGSYMTATPPPLSDEVQAILAEQGIDFETSGLKFLTNEARVRACHAAWQAVHAFKSIVTQRTHGFACNMSQVDFNVPRRI